MSDCFLGSVREQNQVQSGCGIKGQDLVCDQNQGSGLLLKKEEQPNFASASPQIPVRMSMCVVGGGGRDVYPPLAWGPEPSCHQQAGTTEVFLICALYFISGISYSSPERTNQ